MDHDDLYDDEPPPSLGTVVDDDRGSLPYHLVHGEALVAAAAWALGEAGVTLVDQSVPWASVRDSGETLVLHDSLCPLTPPDFIAACVARSVADDVAVVGVRPVTDTVKQVTDGVVGATVDREGLLVVCSPVVLPPTAVASFDSLPTTDFTELVVLLRERGDVVLVEAPSGAMRVTSDDDVRVLEALRQEPLGQA
ncbi:2-C-methyl-D-erythritol 4-phosphate cytidylyltransferase [Nocardioides sp. 1609]|uniref:2-C-methyl-D-erythritol 4-phosphate cytidylyltransferase n=1 Tax=Nocardioides sp. 1609 TaxID=2508327 RepID=UPI001070138D|nr:2-C-methyl-D-erythritol 4-phosphate cytidylyltransferase [Nocardioides sp. 1609]